ncbi:metal ABC transporter permease [candidate division KSB1 bacterium]|nr:metal ABC transporter permease [candidate division KSB1 bacterium]RQW03839.1 MAG: metal ABC transporter permease [candidate division KSB1 bacterium]
MEALLFMSAPFVACLTLIGIHGYFGIHVLKRGIIFIDIAMAQIAALGVTFAFIFHIDHESPWTYPVSLAFVSLAAWFFSSLKCKQPRICMEAIIGISYAVAATAAVLIIDKAAGSHEHTKEMLIGSILWVQWPEIIKSVLVYSLIGGFHVLFRHKFIPLSEDYEAAIKSGMKTRVWDFLFYLSLGIVVMHSVRIGGILIVFAFLIIPSSISALFSTKWLPRIIIGWLTGTVVSLLGLILSWHKDVPSGPAVVLFLGIFLVLAIFARRIIKQKVTQGAS